MKVKNDTKCHPEEHRRRRILSIFNIVNGILHFVQNDKTFLVLFLILLLAAFFRFYRIREYIAFLGDEGRDVLVVKRMLLDHKLTLLGPITSVGSMYMGPAYYYLMAPFLWLWHFDPVGPAIMVALFSLATIFLIYKIGKDFIHPYVGIIAAFLYAISPLTIIYGRSSWNPNVVPFFSSLLMYAMLKTIVNKHYLWLIIVGFCLGVLIQLHYITIVFIPIIFFCLALIRFKIPVKNLFFGLFAFLLAYSPFLLFELRHQFVNIRGVFSFLGEQRGFGTNIIAKYIPRLLDIFVRIFWRLTVVGSAELTKVLILLAIIAFFLCRKNLIKNKKTYLATKVLLVWLVVGLLSFGLYQGAFYDYYFGSLFAVVFLWSGYFLYLLWQSSTRGKFITVVLLVILSYFNFKNSPLSILPNNLLQNTQDTARFIYEKTKGKRYNFALIAGKNSDHAYRYFLELWGNPPMTIESPDSDPKRETVTDELWVICEEKICHPLGHSLWEIAGFGRAEIDGHWQVVTSEVFRLIHYNL